MAGVESYMRERYVMTQVCVGKESVRLVEQLLSPLRTQLWHSSNTNRLHAVLEDGVMIVTGERHNQPEVVSIWVLAYFAL